MIINSVSTSFNNSIQMYTFNVPKYSNILDVIIDNYNQVYLSYSTESNNSDHKDVFVYIIKSYESNTFIGDNYRFLRTSSVTSIDSYNTSSGKTVTINTEIIQNNYLIFLDENKQVDEKRDETLNKIL